MTKIAVSGLPLVATEVATPDGPKKHAAKGRRKSSPHKGVVLIPPRKGARHKSWRARWLDPDLQRYRWESLDLDAYRTAGAREKAARDWAIGKATELADRTRALKGGAPRHEGKLLSDAIKHYHASTEHDHRELTRVIYRGHTAAFVAWAASHGITSVDSLNRAALTAFNTHVAKQKKRVPAKGEGVGTARVATTVLRSRESVKQTLRTIGTVLRFLHEAGWLPALSRDDIRYGLALKTKGKGKSTKDPTAVNAVFRKKPSLTAEQCRAVLRRAIDLDAMTFELTREEKERGLTVGTTPRYDPIAPFVATLLLTGMRDDEARSLRWDRVDLPVRRIALQEGDTKTGAARDVRLSVCPSLIELLTVLKESASGPYVFGGRHELKRSHWDSHRRRMVRGTVKWSAQTLRRTCGTVLVCATGIMGGAVRLAAEQLGHNTTTAEKHYTSAAWDVPHDARTIEAAIGVEEHMAEIIAAARAR